MSRSVGLNATQVDNGGSGTLCRTPLQATPPPLEERAESIDSSTMLVTPDTPTDTDDLDLSSTLDSTNTTSLSTVVWGNGCVFVFGRGLRRKRMGFYNELTECLSFNAVVKCKYGCSFYFLLLHRLIMTMGGASACSLSVFCCECVLRSWPSVSMTHTADTSEFSPAHVDGFHVVRSGVIQDPSPF